MSNKFNLKESKNRYSTVAMSHQFHPSPKSPSSFFSICVSICLHTIGAGSLFLISAQPIIKKEIIEITTLNETDPSSQITQSHHIQATEKTISSATPLPIPSEVPSPAHSTKQIAPQKIQIKPMTTATKTIQTNIEEPNFNEDLATATSEPAPQMDTQSFETELEQNLDQINNAEKTSAHTNALALNSNEEILNQQEISQLQQRKANQIQKMTEELSQNKALQKNNLQAAIKEESQSLEKAHQQESQLQEETTATNQSQSQNPPQAQTQTQAPQNISPSPQNIRSISALKQMPGNPEPKYSDYERLQKQQGQVIFQAYVSPEGQLSKFKLIQSTGVKSLDEKTLLALKKWKFYPGQEGWVEIPRVWSLKGNIEYMAAPLRRTLVKKDVTQK